VKLVNVSKVTGQEIVFEDSTTHFLLNTLLVRTTEFTEITLIVKVSNGNNALGTLGVHVSLNRQQLEISAAQHAWFCCLSS